MNIYTEFWKSIIKDITAKIDFAKPTDFEMDASILETSIGKRESSGYNGKLIFWAGVVEYYKDSAVFRDLKGLIESSPVIKNNIPGELTLSIYGNITLKVSYRPMNFDLLIERYRSIPEAIKLREIYKWRLIKKFQEGWARYQAGLTSFKDFFLAVDFRNLIYPIGIAVIKQAAKEKPVEFEQLLANLFDESKELKERIPAYVKNFENLYFSLPDHGKNSLQDERTIATLLAFRFPEKYTLFKDSFYSRLSKGFGIKPKPPGEKIFHYYAFIHELLSHLQNNVDIIKEKENRLDESCYDDKNNMLLAQDVFYLTLTTATEVDASDNILNDTEINYIGKRYWLIAPGEGAYLWDEFYNNNKVGIGWEKIKDLSLYESKDEIKNDLLEVYPEFGKSQSNNSLCLWQFSKEMKPVDIVIAKKGIDEYVGYGIVGGEYYHDDSRSNFKHLRQVEWKKKGSWQETLQQIVTKTLTDITKYPDYVDRLKRLIGIEQEATVDADKIEYYWLNANPKFWRIEDFQVGDEQEYTTHNDKGNKRNKFEYFQTIKPGDLVIGYETTPTKKVIAVYEITKGAFIDEDDGVEKIAFKIQKFLPTPISYDTLKNMQSLNNSEVMKNNQGSLFKLSKEEYHAIVDKDINTETGIPEYSIADAEKDIFLDKDDIQNIIQTLEYKKNIILQGAPGVGKTFMAKRIAYLMMEGKDDTKVEMIQFHQSYSYEDFMQGYRPKDGSGFKLENGVFYRFCKRAQADPGNKYFFIIDEINRGNLSKIFGELMLLIEADKRGVENGISLTYTASNENRFYIPGNVYLIGTMNTADRSLAVVDYALRKRFAFIPIKPCFNKKFREELLVKRVNTDIIDGICEKLERLNEAIANDKDLGSGFKVGHSYFCNIPKDSGDIEWYHRIVKNELTALLNEYWFDNEDRAKSEIAKLYFV